MKNFTTGQIILSLASLGMTILFGFWSYYQMNDVDSFRWVMIYGLAGIISLIAATNRLPAIVPIILGALCLGWAVYLSTQITYGPPLITIEEWREMMGLLVIASWMGILSWIFQRRQTQVHE